MDMKKFLMKLLFKLCPTSNWPTLEQVKTLYLHYKKNNDPHYNFTDYKLLEYPISHSL